MIGKYFFVLQKDENKYKENGGNEEILRLSRNNASVKQPKQQKY